MLTYASRTEIKRLAYLTDDSFIAAYVSGGQGNVTKDDVQRVRRGISRPGKSLERLHSDLAFLKRVSASGNLTSAQAKAMAGIEAQIASYRDVNPNLATRAVIFSNEDKVLMRALYANGRSFKSIGNRFGRSPEMIARLFKREGWV